MKIDLAATQLSARKAMKELNALIKLDDLKEIEIEGKSGFVHKEHRFVLPVVLYAQRAGLLPQPCDLICFDNHHDCCVPKNIQDLQKKDLDKISIGEFIEFCDKDLNKLDDDWVIAGIELGMFDSCTFFGVTKSASSVNHIINNEYSDTKGIKHKIFIKGFHPGPMLDYQGDLSDYSKEHLEEFWKTIHWANAQGEGFKFRENIDPFLLDIDLDCFCIYWSDYTFPWQEEVYEDRYFKTSSYGTTKGLSGKRVFQDIVKNAGLITIAKEPGPCGGIEKANIIFNDINKHLFDNNLKFLTNL